MNSNTDPIQVDLIRANQRDEFFVDLLQKKIIQSLSHILGPDIVLKYITEIQMVGDSLYFFLTTSERGRTLGEEYINSVPVVQGRSSISASRRITSIILRSLPLYTFSKLYMSRYIREKHKTLHKFLGTLNDVVIPCIFKIHFTFFFLFGGPMRLAERISGINFRFLSPTDRPKRSRHWVLATILMIHICFALYSNRNRLLSQGARDALFELKNYFANFFPSTATSSTSRAAVPLNRPPPKRTGIFSSFFPFDVFSSSKTQNSKVQSISHGVYNVECQICRCEAQHPSCGPCGHVMCWECLAEWVVFHSSCPMCRTPCLPQQLIRVHHYDASSVEKNDS
eukprot:GDKJ01036465.1.p1 GENE.GDKJ01036465.1~~GDKJ01036465.1.p1  ORF type:complete len:339 (+),score=13.90 GDKJ01036465.1:46-1062(+)